MSLSSIITHSKVRCQELGIAPHSMPVLEEQLSGEDLDNRLLLYRDILDVVNFFIKKFLVSMEGTPILVAVADGEGYILDLLGDASIRDMMNRLGIVKGIRFTEKETGTNAISLAIKYEQPIQLIGTDHYHEILHQSVCYSNPFYSNGNLLGVIGFFTTISNANPSYRALLSTIVDAIEREILLRKQNAEFHILNQMLLDTSHQCVIITDHEGTILEMNHQSTSIFMEMKKGDCVLTTPILGHYLSQAILMQEEINAVEIPMILNEKEYVFILDVKPIYEAKTNKLIRVLGSFRDITEMKKTEQLLRNSEKLAVVGQMAAGVAHEIRNPLTTLKGFLELIRGKFDQPTHYELIMSEFDRINLITEELLVLGKPQAVKFEDFNCLTALKDILTIFEAQAQMNDINFHIDIAQPGIINGDPNQIKQVYVNILKNALEAMPFGGNLYIQTQQIEDKFLIRFIDDGEGIDETMLEKLGQPFSSTKSYGNGLGLMVTKKIIDTHQGELRFYSRVGQGTTVEVIFPVSK